MMMNNTCFRVQHAALLLFFLVAVLLCGACTDGQGDTPTVATPTVAIPPSVAPTPSPSVTVRAHPQDWRTCVPTDTLTLETSPYQATIALVGVQDGLPFIEPLQPITLTLHIEGYSGLAEVRLYDTALRPSGTYTVQVQAGQAAVVVTPRGYPGTQCALVLVDGRIAGGDGALFTLDAITTITTGLPDIDLIIPTVRSFLQQDVVSYELDGRVVRGYRSPDNPLLWLRDHVYQGRGFRYFEHDVTSLLDAFCRAQQPDGSFPDVLDYPALSVEAHRLATESDLEYLFVQGVYEAWQMTGDDAWLRKNRDAMYRGIAFITSDPQRWDSKIGLVRRPYTIDTWDFQYGPTTLSPEGKPSPRHWIDDQTIWGIFHGDNTGLAYALKLMERMERHLGNNDAAYRVRSQRNDMMARLHRLSWRGPFYTHFVLPDGSLPAVTGVDTGKQVSLSNALALNREVLEFEQCRAILETYHQRRNFDRAFAEWYSIDPPFPSGSFGLNGGKGEQPGEYVNGGIMPLVGGELARGAFSCGSEAYGFDILRRYAELLRLTGSSYLWYYPDGRPGISGNDTLSTDGWGASAMLGALMEGAAGVVDKGSRYSDLELSPRWSMLPEIQTVRVVARYGASDGYVAYIWRYEPLLRQLSLSLTGTWEHAEIRLLLPPDGQDTRSRTLQVNGDPVPFEKKKVGTGQYIVFETTGGNADVVLWWEKE